MADPTRALRLGRLETNVSSVGPGRRAGVWVRGCSLRCPGCTSPAWLDPGDPTDTVSVEDIWSAIAAAHAAHGLEGVTFSGGEPFEQAPALTALARLARAAGLSVIAWSGRLRHQLELGLLPGSAAMLAELDVLIDGPYLAARRTTRLPLRGSDNQHLHLLTDRYVESDFRADLEMRVGPEGVHSFGVVDPEALSLALALVGAEKA